MTAKNLYGARTFQLLSNDISEESKILNQYRSFCQEERLKLAKLRLQKEKLESVVRQFQNNNEDFLRIRDIVKHAIEQCLTNHRYLIEIVFLSVIDSCRYNPPKFNILYHNLPTITKKDKRLVLSERSKNDYGLSADKQLCYQHNNINDYVYEKIFTGGSRAIF